MPTLKLYQTKLKTSLAEVSRRGRLKATELPLVAGRGRGIFYIRLLDRAVAVRIDPGFSPLEVGKEWFYSVSKLGLEKEHGIDAWVLAYHQIQGKLDNQKVIGGFLKDRLDGRRLTQNARVEDLTLLNFSSWRVQLLPSLTEGVSAA